MAEEKEMENKAGSPAEEAAASSVTEPGVGKTEESKPCCCSGKGRPGSELKLEHGPLRKIAIAFKVVCWLSVAFALLQIADIWQMYSQVPAEYMSQFMKKAVLSTLLMGALGAIVAMVFYALSECIKVVVETAQNMRTLRDTVKEHHKEGCCK
ncbi:MAG: hypothetical protein WCS77_03470 [Elusimicrobiaceae bacterium]